MQSSQNGYPVITDAGSSRLHTWIIKTKTGTLSLRIIAGPVGFVLAHLVMWIGDSIQDITGKVKDDWGWADRDIRGSSTISNHASGTAVDLDSLIHVLGKRGTWKSWQYVKIRAALRFVYKGAIRWGADYVNRADEMHFEANKGRASFVVLARTLVKGDRGKRLIAANPSQSRAILS